jgi:thymidylate kinase
LTVPIQRALRRFYGEVDPRQAVAQEFAAAAGDAAILYHIISLFRTGNWAAIEELGKAIRARPREPAQGAQTGRLRRRLRRASDALRNGRRRRGFSIAVIGPEGAGKSTLVEGLKATIPLPVTTFNLGIDEGLLGRVGRWPAPGVRFLVTTAIVWARYLRARREEARSRLVVFERHLCDAAAPVVEHLSPLQFLERRLATHLCPRPDFIFFLDVRGAVMFERTQRFSPVALEDARWYFRQLKNRIPEIIVVDADREPREIRVEVTARVWREFTDRWERRSWW